MADNISRMPALFIGHGSPMNAIEDNEFTRQWEKLSLKIPRPEAILSVSAHWYTGGTKTTDISQPRIVYDMYGFPEELYKVSYPVKGSPHIAGRLGSLLKDEIIMDNSWGIDHGTWSVLCRVFPEADIPVVQLSIDAGAGPQVHFELGQKLSVLREEGVLILGSGNVVHNLALVDWKQQGGYSWAEEFDGYIKENILEKNYRNVLNYKEAGQSYKKAFPTPEHFYPLLYVLGASKEDDRVEVFNDSCTLGALSMTSYLFQ